VKLDLHEAVDRFGADAFRYFLLREVPWDGDGNFSWERFEERYVSDLADGLGNLASRSLAMLERYRAGVVPTDETRTPLDETGEQVVTRFAAAMDALDLRGAAETAWDLVSRANGYIVETAPWALAKAGRDSELDTVLAALARCLARLAAMTSPFMPAKAESLWLHLGAPVDVQRRAWETAMRPAVGGWRATKPGGLFPKPQELPTPK
jgi:methionyl-tRNA synthetase